MVRFESLPQKLFNEYGFSLPENPEDTVPVELGDMAGGNMEAAHQSGLAENMSITASGPTWNLGWNFVFNFGQITC